MSSSSEDEIGAAISSSPRPPASGRPSEVATSSPEPQQQVPAARGKIRRGGPKVSALLAALRALGLFLLLRFVLVHGTIIYLALSHAEDEPATAGVSVGGAADPTTTQQPPTSEVAPQSPKKEKKIKKEKIKKKKKEPKEPRPPPEPIIKTTIKTVTETKMLTGLTSDQIDQLESELASFEPSQDADYDVVLDRSTRIGDAIAKIDELIESIGSDLLPRSVEAGVGLRSDLDDATAALAALDQTDGGQPSREASTQRRRYGALLPTLRSVLAVESYGEWDDGTLAAKFENAFKDLNGIERDNFTADAGVVFRSVLGDELKVRQEAEGADTDGDGEGGGGVGELTCDPAFLLRDPTSTGSDDDNDGDGAAVRDETTTIESEVASSEVSAPPVDRPEPARESDLFALVGSIEAVLRDRTGRYSGFLEHSSEDEEGTVGPLSTEDGLAKFRKVVNTRAGSARIAVHREKTKLDEEVRLLEEEAEGGEAEGGKEEEEEEEEEGADADGTCVTEEDVTYMLDEGMDALLRNKDLTEELESALRIMYDEKQGGGGEFDASTIDWNEGVDGEVVEEGVGRGRGRGGSEVIGSASTDSSYAHRDTLRSLADTPLFPKLMDKIDVLADALGGYNDHVDDLIDALAGDESEGGSLGGKAGTALLNLLGKVPIPPQAKVLSEKAGLLRNGV